MKGLYCSKPFQNIEIHNDGDVYFCCPQWLKTPIGNIKKDSLTNVWNSPVAENIRASIEDGSYRYCDHANCPYIASGFLDQKAHQKEVRPKKVMLVYDLSCNLSCPSCRSELKMLHPGSEEMKKVEHFNTLVLNELIRSKSDQPLTLNMTGSGDPFASLAFKNLLNELAEGPPSLLKIDIQTNALLFNAGLWNKFIGLQKNFNAFFVSIDAATKETYEDVRRGGSWEVLIKNMTFLSELRREKKIALLQARFVVQKKNFREMGKFVSTFLDLGCDVIEFSLLNDWESWSKEEFSEQCVWRKDHPLYHSFLSALCDYRLGKERVFLGNVAPYRAIALNERNNGAHPLQKTLWNIQEFFFKKVNKLEAFKIAASKKLLKLFFKRT